MQLTGILWHAIDMKQNVLMAVEHWAKKVPLGMIAEYKSDFACLWVTLSSLNET